MPTAPAHAWAAGQGGTRARDTLEPVQPPLCSEMGHQCPEGPSSPLASPQATWGSGPGVRGTMDAASNALPMLFLGRVKFIQEI